MKNRFIPDDMGLAVMLTSSHCIGYATVLNQE
jgi:hypothetical protein